MSVIYILIGLCLSYTLISLLMAAWCLRKDMFDLEEGLVNEHEDFT